MPAPRPVRSKLSAVRLAYPRAGGSVHASALGFRWGLARPSRGVRYRLSVYSMRPGEPLEKAVLGRPVYQASDLRKPAHKIPAGHALKLGKAYCWKVDADLGAGRVVSSGIRGFRLTPRERVTPVSGVSMGDMSALRDPALHLPPAPFLWGHPVVWRARRSIPSGGGDDGGTTEPGWKWTVWGTEAARLFLIEPFWTNARFAWDYSTQAGCDQVLLQIAGPDGFADPNSTNARADAGVAAWYSGPVTVQGNCLGEILNFEGDVNHGVPADQVDLQYTGEPHEFWDNLSVRLVPLDAAGNQSDVASDHVSVGCVDLPLISMETCNVEWTWGESPMRRIEFTLRLGREFPTTGEAAPSTLVIAGLTPHTGRSIANSVLTNVRLLNDDRVETGTAGEWNGKPAYFALLPEWTDGGRVTYTLEQRADNAGANAGLLGHLLHFTDLHLLVYCVPGLTPSTYTCGGRMSDGHVPDVSCGEVFEGRFYDAELRGIDLHAGEITSGLEPIFELMTSTLTGTKRTVRTVDGETNDRTEDVTIQFRYVEDLEDAEAFELYLMRSTAANSPSTITMLESKGDSLTSYEFQMLGFHATIAPAENRYELYGGSTPGTPGRLIFDPPNLRMEFQIERGTWNEEERRWIDDVETFSYEIHR